MASAFLLAQFFCLKRDQFLVTELCRGLDRVAAYFAILHIRLLHHRYIQQKGNFFPTVRTLKKMLVHGLKIDV
jgi:hypothetical protein